MVEREASILINLNEPIGKVNPFVLGQFIEHFPRQIYGGIYEEESPHSDSNGFRLDVEKALNGSQNEQIREWEQEGIINHMDNLGNVPIAYLGDLNSFSPEDWGLNNQTGLGYGPLSMMIYPYNNPDTGGNFSAYSSTIHSWTDVHRTLNPTDWDITYPGIYHSRIDFIYVNQFLSSYIINSTTGDTAHAMTGSDHLTVDVFFNLS